MPVTPLFPDPPPVSPFLDDTTPFSVTSEPPAFSYSRCLPPEASDHEPSHAALNDALDALRNGFPGRSEFAITNMDSLLLLSKQLLESTLQGFDLAVLLFLMGHFQHKRPFIPFPIGDIASTLDRQPSQIRRSINKLKRLGWILADNRGDLMLNTHLLRSANPRYRAIGFRLARERFTSRS